MAKIVEHKYVKLGKVWTKTVEVVDKVDALTIACEAKAAENSGMVVCGVSVNGDIKHVDVLEMQQ